MSHPVLERLRDPDPTERRDACRAAAADPSAVLLIDGLVEALGDPERSVVRAASDAIARIGAGQPETERALRRALRGDSAARRWGAALTLSRIAPPDAGLLPAVVEAMASTDGDVRWSAARLLVDLGRLEPGVLPVVLGLARSAEDPAVRRMAVFCLRDLAPDDPGAADALLEASRAGDGALRRAAFTALASLLDPPRAVWDRLAEALSADRDPAVRALAAHAAGELAARHPGRLPGSLRSLLADAAATAPAGSAADPRPGDGLGRAARAALERADAAPPPQDRRAPASARNDGDLAR